MAEERIATAAEIAQAQGKDRVEPEEKTAPPCPYPVPDDETACPHCGWNPSSFQPHAVVAVPTNKNHPPKPKWLPHFRAV